MKEKLESKPILSVSKRLRNGTLLVRFESGGSVRVTGQHPFFVSSKGFMPADKLVIGDKTAEDANSKTDAIAAITEIPGEQAVYNLVVAEDHTYFVRTTDGTWLWVHNGPPCGIHAGTGIAYNAAGFPIFDDVAIADVQIEPGPSRRADFRRANKARGVKQEPKTTWHHHQDHGRMQLVPTKIHGKVWHKGGYSIWGAGR